MNPKSNAQLKEYDGYDQANNDPRLLDEDFINKQGLSSKATRFDVARKAANDEQYAMEAANEALYEEEQINATMEEEEERAMRLRQVQVQQELIKSRNAKVKLGGKVRVISKLGIVGAFVSYTWQLTFGIISLIGFGGQALVQYILEDTILGKILGKTLGLFFDIGSIFPMDYIAIIFWALASLIAVCTFLYFLLLFTFAGVRPFGTTVTAIITTLAFTLSILPISNVFIPSILLWVIYMNVTSTISSLKTMVKH